MTEQRTLVAGIDSSTQSCKVVVRDADTGELVRQGRASHPDGTEIDPALWWGALGEAVDQAGGLDDVQALSVGAQQHGMVCLDEAGEVVRPALLWNDTRSGQAALDLRAELGADGAGDRAWAEAVGVVPVSSFTVTKLRWLARNEPAAAERTAAVALPHDWLTWKLAGAAGIETLTTDRSDASGTGYWSATTGEYRRDLLTLGLGHDAVLPAVLGPRDTAGSTPTGAALGAGAGDNAAAGLGVGARPGDVVISIGTSGTVFAVADNAVADPSGIVAGFADATGRHLPLVCTLNAARVLDAVAGTLGVTLDELGRLALSAPAGSDGLVVVPYLEGERTPDRPDATGSVHGLTLRTSTAAHLARAAIEGMLCGLADGLDALIAQGVRCDRVLLVGGGARSEAVCRIASALLGRPVVVPAPGEYVADGAARQAAWLLSGGTEPPEWSIGDTLGYEEDAAPQVRERYAAARDKVLPQVG
ncbi:xylulokinase [Actinoalloteichus caeruleus]|uniref:Xylulose kinase n=2 Tax=Actinoalloteichus cyanogriseus TaxID=2893586 RepID=A0ABT1JL57_ACTCY|nr:xylulokinase [Actinoalloteichus caeruleus]MCP2333246.1 xylulokinase [Actinoalloteichus caeruleus DSM 43889]